MFLISQDANGKIIIKGNGRRNGVLQEEKNLLLKLHNVPFYNRIHFVYFSAIPTACENVR